MSYDVAIFFNSSESKINNVKDQLANIFGIPFDSDEEPEARVFGLEFYLSKRKSYLKDEEGMKFSDYSFQLEITSRIAGTDIIHPIGFMIAETLSANTNDSVMFCLSSVEILGAVFKNGKIINDKMSNLNEVIGNSRWNYSRNN
ncbi:hypothetical protein [Pleionea sediminis]|uniref:hypothetical protein n=1 Tax=Pleionea sediminis TaxID=2569479 RepID=UPI001185392B|nr:hypothetical protein [Pleionea sediminis]